MLNIIRKNKQEGVMSFSSKDAFVVPPSMHSIVMSEICSEYQGNNDKHIEALLGDKIASDLKSCISYSNTTLPLNHLTKNDKWRLMSSLQKSIRRSDVDNSIIAARCLYAIDPYNFYRRLGVIVLEDIGLANLELVALVMFIRSNKAWADKLGAEFVAVYLAEQMAKTVKDRALCDLAYGAWISPEVADKKKQWLEIYDSEELAKVYSKSNVLSSHLKQIAALALTGNLHDGNGKKSPKHLPEFLSALVSYDLPDLLSYIVRKAMASAMEGLVFPIPLIYSAVGSEEIEVVEAPIPPLVMINGIPSVSYDKHVLEGRKALAYFSKSCAPVSSWLKSYEHDKVALLGSAVFWGESGSVLKHKLSYGYASLLFEATLTYEALRYHLQYQDMMALYHMVRDNLDALNHARLRVCN